MVILSFVAYCFIIILSYNLWQIVILFYYYYYIITLWYIFIFFIISFTA